MVVAPPNTISNPALESSTTMLSQASEPTFVILPSLTLRLVTVAAAAEAAPITVPSIDPPSILAVVTVPRSAIVVPAKVLFLPTTICSLPSVVVNLRYEFAP